MKANMHIYANGLCDQEAHMSKHNSKNQQTGFCRTYCHNKTFSIVTSDIKKRSFPHTHTFIQNCSYPEGRVQKLMHGHQLCTRCVCFKDITHFSVGKVLVKNTYFILTPTEICLRASELKVSHPQFLCTHVTFRNFGKKQLSRFPTAFAHIASKANVQL